MSFLKGILSLNISSSLPEEGHSSTRRVQLALHPEESEEYAVSRLLSLAHCFSFEPQFSQGLFAPKEPTITAINEIGQQTLWAEVGVPPLKKLRKALNQFPQPTLRVYFYSDQQVDQFCHLLRGSKENWIAPITFFQFGRELIDQITEREWTMANRWELVFLEESIYAELDGVSLEGRLRTLDMWSEFQRTLREQENVTRT